MVVQAVRQVTSEHAHLHTAILDVRQMFHTLSVYGIEVTLPSNGEGTRDVEKL